MTAPERLARPSVVGLIGGIGSGKSAAAKEFAKRGATIVAADDLGHQALREPAIHNWLVARWGEGLLEGGEISRPRLGAVVFADPEARRELEAKVHPWIRHRAREEIAKAKAADPSQLVVLDAALLLEAGWNTACDRVVFVEAPAQVRLARAQARSGWTEQELLKRESAQLPLTEKRSRADDVLDNSSDLEHLSRQVEDLMRLWGRGPAPARE